MARLKDQALAFYRSHKNVLNDAEQELVRLVCKKLVLAHGACRLRSQSDDFASISEGWLALADTVPQIQIEAKDLASAIQLGSSSSAAWAERIDREWPITPTESMSFEQILARHGTMLKLG